MSPVNWGGMGQGGHHTYKTAAVLQTKCSNGTATANTHPNPSGWVDICDVTMTAVKDDSVYHLTIQGNAQGNGRAGRFSGHARPQLRILRDGATNYNLGHVSGWEGRASTTSNNNFDSSQLSYTGKDEPGINAGQNVNYKAQLWASLSGSGPNGVNFGKGIFGLGATNNGGSLTVMEVQNEGTN